MGSCARWIRFPLLGRWLLLCALALALLPGPAAAWTFTQIDVPGAWDTLPYGINSRGQIVGSYDFRGFLRDRDGTFTTIDVPGADAIWAIGINGRGQIVGQYSVYPDGLHAFLRDPDGTITTIDPPGAVLAAAVGINRRGQIVGWYWDGHRGHGFLRDPDGTFATMDVPGALGTEANGIKGRRIVGSYKDPATFHRRGFLAAP